MINKITKKLGKEKLYVTINPEVLREMIENAKIVCGTYKEVYQRLGICESSIFKMKRGNPTAVSSHTILNLMNLTNMKITLSDIIDIRSRPSGYSLPANLIFMKNPFYILNDWDNYLLGAIASDGSICDGHIYLRIAPYDVEFSAVQIYTLANLTERINKESVKITIGTSECEGFGKIGILNSVSMGNIMLTIFLENILKVKLNTNYSIPYWLYSNRQLSYPWLAGLIDGDGCVSINKNKDKWYLEISNGNVSPLTELKNLLVQNICYFKTKPRKEKLTEKYLLRTSSNKLFQKLAPKILPFVIIERKRERIIQVLDHLNIKIPKMQRTTRNSVMDEVVKFLKERNLLTRLQNWEKLETYGKDL